MFIGLVTEAENDILEAGKLVFAIREFERLVRKVLAELNGVVRRFSLTVSSHDKEYAAIFRQFA